jgi:glutathione S-transferase
LAKNDFLVGRYSIADIALFAYTHVAHEGGFPLDDFPKIRAWIEQVKAQAGYIAMG